VYYQRQISIPVRYCFTVLLCLSGLKGCTEVQCNCSCPQDIVLSGAKTQKIQTFSRLI